MSLSTKVGKDASLQNGGVSFQTFRDLVKQREALDHQILRLQGRLFKIMEKNALKASLAEKAIKASLAKKALKVSALKKALKESSSKKALKANSAKNSTSPLDSKKYVARMSNKIILAAAIRECMKYGKKMGMTDILNSIECTGSYHTRSKYFYTMVNNKLHTDPLIKRVSRGVFVLHKQSGRPKKVAS